MKDDPTPERRSIPRSDPPARSKLPPAGDMSGAGLQVGFAIILFAFGGYWLDKTLGTSPWLLIAMVFLGAGAAYLVLRRKLFGSSASRKPPKP